MTDKQLQGIEVAEVLMNLSAGQHNKARTMLMELGKYDPQTQPAVIAKVSAMFLAVDRMSQDAIAWLEAVKKDAEYPA